MKNSLQPSPALLDQVVAIARRAGAEIMAVYRNGPVVSARKADNSPLTQADLRAHRSIVAALRALTPQLPVLSEESAAEDFLQRRDWPCHWLVDPLDGTKEFLARNGEFTVNIALIDGDTPVLGVVQLPTLDRVYAGARGLGAQRIEADGTARSIQVRRPAQAPLRVLGSRSHGNEAMGAVLARLGPHELLAVGSSIKFCFVAEGRADLYPRMGPTSEWDTAAGHAVLEAAGGALRRLSDGDPLRYNGAEDFLNPQFVAYGDESCWERWQLASAG
jgi:3'(2'), 5'-bisphosphate nucleotidase